MVDNLNRKNSCVIVSHNPDNILFSFIKKYRAQFDKIIIVDNNSEIDILNRLDSLVCDAVLLIKNNTNYGIAKALNQGIVKSHELGYKWVVTFDQDSKPQENIISILQEAYELYPKKEQIGAVGINFVLENGKSYYPQIKGVKYSERDYLITSGCMMSVDAFMKVGGFREDFFIDNVDIEYSLRLRKNSKKLLITNDWGMAHDPGSRKTKEYFGVKISSTNHSVLRRFYMARNHVIVSIQYCLHFPYFILKLNYFFVLSLLQILLVEKNKLKKLSASAKGLISGLCNLKRKQYVFCEKYENE